MVSPALNLFLAGYSLASLAALSYVVFSNLPWIGIPGSSSGSFPVYSL